LSKNSLGNVAGNIIARKLGKNAWHTDSRGYLTEGFSFVFKTSSSTPTGTWTAWVKVNGKKSNDQKFIVAESEEPVFSFWVNKPDSSGASGVIPASPSSQSDTPRGGD
ncbi:hypothetical protein HY227_01280, partial [Candidatus Wolfebacteria bacterium]|nr:hypothetical protein [Candidatus Wolfebacteria bacterium]